MVKKEDGSYDVKKILLTTLITVVLLVLCGGIAWIKDDVDSKVSKEVYEVQQIHINKQLEEISSNVKEQRIQTESLDKKMDVHNARHGRGR